MQAHSIAEAKLKVLNNDTLYLLMLWFDNFSPPPLQLADVGCAVHLCTLLHQRYAEFSEMLLEDLQRIYQTPINKDDDKVSKEGGGADCNVDFRAVCSNFQVQTWTEISRRGKLIKYHRFPETYFFSSHSWY